MQNALNIYFFIIQENTNCLVQFYAQASIKVNTIINSTCMFMSIKLTVI